MDDGDRKYAAKNYEGALKSYRAAHAIMGVPTTGIEVAKAEEALGHLLEAREVCIGVSRIKVAGGDNPAFVRARADCERRTQKLAGRIASVKITVTGAPPGGVVSIWVDESAIPEAALGLPRKLNPGKHRIAVEVQGRAPAHAEVSLREGEQKEIKIALGADLPGAPAPASGRESAYAPPAPPAYAYPPPPGPIAYGRRSSGMFAGGIVLTCLGSVGLLSGTAVLVFGRDGTAGLLTILVSGGALGGGIAMTVIGGKKIPLTPHVAMEPVLAPGYGGLRLTF